MAEATELRSRQRVRMRVSGQDAAGRTADFDGPLTWNDDHGIINIQTDPADDNVATFDTPDEVTEIETFTVTATGDPKQGAESGELVVVFPFVLLPRDVATAFGTVESVTDIDAAAPPA